MNQFLKLISNILYRASFFELKEDIIKHKNIKYRREYIVHPPAVGIIPVLPDSRIVMVEQYRDVNNLWSLEIPAGKVEKKEKLKQACRRELEEETGFIPGKLTKLFGYYPTIAYSTETITIFLATELKRGKQNPERDEFIKIKILSLSEILDKIYKNEISDAKTILAILFYKNVFLKGKNNGKTFGL